jgi:hypothetical protein
MAAPPFSHFPRYPKWQVEAAMAARRDAASTKAEAAWLCRPGGALQQLLRSDSEKAAAEAHAVKEAAGAYRKALERYGDGDGGVTVGSVRAEPLPVAHSAHPRCEPAQPVTSPCVLRRQMMAHAMFAAGRVSFASDTPKTADLHRSMLNPVGVYSHMPAAVRRSRPPEP